MATNLLISRLAPILCISFLLSATTVSLAQKAEKEISQNAMVWVSINSTMRVTNQWGLMADFHVRRTDFVVSPNFYFARAGVVYWFKTAAVAFGYANLLLAPSPDSISTWSDEHRFFQQIQYSSKVRNASMTQRMRNEQRWKQEVDIPLDEKTGDYNFTNRIRFLISFSIPVSNNKKIPSIVLANEVLIQFGKKTVYNTFEQNRTFIGIRQDLGKNFSFDFGYMYIFQQKPTGYQYDSNHTLRLFFYYAPDFRKDKTVVYPVEPVIREE